MAKERERKNSRYVILYTSIIKVCLSLCFEVVHKKITINNYDHISEEQKIIIYNKYQVYLL